MENAVDARDHFATKEDLAKLETRLTRWIMGLMFTAIINVGLSVLFRVL